jgi:DNA-directed RNA polymerase specialized sigma24 family protein
MQSETEYFRRVYEATYEDMLRYAVIKTRRAADIEDILQNAYSRFFSRITRRGHGDIDDPKAYLMSILQKELSGFYRFKNKGGKGAAHDRWHDGAFCRGYRGFRH